MSEKNGETKRKGQSVIEIEANKEIMGTHTYLDKRKISRVKKISTVWKFKEALSEGRRIL